MNTPPNMYSDPDAAAGAAPDDAGKDMAAGEDCIPLSSLAMPDPDNGDQMANPEVGDKVQYQVEGTVTRIEGENAYVKRETVNGEPVSGEDDDGGGEEPGEDDQEGQNLRDAAGQMGGM